jgi:polyisoprenoid-binding protein YceI
MATSLWEIDAARSDIRFWVRYMVVTRVRGRFARWAGTITIDDEDLTRSCVSARIESASIEPRWGARDPDAAEREARITSAAFLDVARYPAITFRSTRVEKMGAGYRVLGELVLHGVGREVALEVQSAGVVRDGNGAERAHFSAGTILDRRDYGLVWDSALEAGSVVVGDRIGIVIELEAVRRAAAPSLEVLAAAAAGA